MNVITVVSGNNQNAGIKVRLTDIVLLVSDEAGDPVSSVTLICTSIPPSSETVGTVIADGSGVTQSDGSVSLTTGADGKATLRLTLGDEGGKYIVGVASTGLAAIALSAYCTAIISLRDAKAYLAMTDATNDALITGWVNEATAQIEAILNQPVQPRYVEELADGNGWQKLCVQRGHIYDLVSPYHSSVQSRDSVASGWTDIVPSDDYIYLDPTDSWHIELLDFYSFPEGSRNIRIVYLAGYLTVPGDFTEVCVQMVTTMWDQSKAGGSPRLGMQSDNRGAGGGTVGKSFVDMDVRWASMLSKYRRLV